MAMRVRAMNMLPGNHAANRLLDTSLHHASFRNFARAALHSITARPLRPMAAVSCFLLLFPLMGGAAAQSQEYPEGFDATQPYLDERAGVVEEEVSYLTVDGVTGEVLETDISTGRGLWNVRIVDVPAKTPGWGLKDPRLKKIASGAVSTSAGYVEFWHVSLVRGMFTVTRQVGLADTVVVVFNHLPSLANTFSDSTSPPGGGDDASNPNDGSCIPGAQQWDVMATSLNWTPLLLVSSPYQGAASASSDYSNAEAQYIMSYGYASRLNTGHALGSSDGESMGWFQLVEWSLVRIKWRHANCAMEDRWSTYISDPEPTGSSWRIVWDLTGTDRRTAADDVVRFTESEFRSVKFDMRFKRPTRVNIDTIGGPGSIYAGTGSQTLWSLGIDVSWSFPGTPAGAGWGAYRGERMEGSTYTYRYDFLAENERWNASYAGSNATWAFCYRSELRC